MKEQEHFAAFSHYQYQSQEARARNKGREGENVQLSFLSKLDKTDVESIKDCLQQGRNVILEHASFVSMTEEEILTQFVQAGVKNVRLLMSLAKIESYIEAENKNQDEILFVSVFALQELTYKPYLLKLLQIAPEKGHLIVYCQKIQTQKLKAIINKAKINEFIEMQLDIPTPFDYIVSDNLLDVLEKFLHDQSKQVTKKDVVIFHPATEEFKKKLFYLTKTKGFHISTTIIYEGQQQSPEQLSSRLHTKIFITQNMDSLLSQNYNLSSLYLVLDYQENTYRYFNYQRSCYVEVRGKLSYWEKCRRVNLNVGNVGEYACCGKGEAREFIGDDEERRYWEYGGYVLAMIRFGLAGVLDQEAKEVPEIGYCVEALKSSETINKENQAVAKQILSLCSEGVNPILAKSILSSLSHENPRKPHLLILCHAILTSTDLRSKNESRPSAIWHKTGYLESCLDIVIKCMSFLEEKEKEVNLISFDQIVLNFQISIQAYGVLIKEYERVCKLVKVQKIKWSQLADEEFEELLEELITIFKPAVGTFSGSRRLGYLFKGANKGFIAHRECLMSLYNEKPNFIFVTKMIIDSEDEKPLILSCNYIRDEILITTYGCLPTLSKQSFGECEIEFHNVSSAIFSHLAKFNGLQMEIFEKENECSIEANSQLNAITIQCSKQKQKEINDKFTKVLQDIEDMFKKETKSFKQSNLLTVIIGTGGEITEFIVRQKGKNNEILEMAIVKNLSPEVGLEELKQLFDEFIQLKDIKVIQKQESNEAIVSFYSAEDFRKFYQYFSGCTYYNFTMIVHPYVDETKEVAEERYLLFEWNVWKSAGEALVEFQTTEGAKGAVVNFRNIAGEGAKVEQKANMIFAEGLDNKVDEKDIAAWVSGNGAILNLEVRRFAPNKPLSQDILIKGVINSAFPNENIACTVGKTIKGKNGHRSCQVTINDRNATSEVIFALNEVTGVLGNGKLYVTPVFTYPINLPEPEDSYVEVYRDIIKDFSKQLGRFEPLETQIVKNPLKWTMVIKSNEEDQMTIIKTMLPQRLKGVPLNINTKDSSLLFTELAQKNFEKLEKKLPVKIMPDIIEKKIKVLCKPSTVRLIEKEINTQIQESFVFQIPLYEKAYIYLQKAAGEILAEQIKNGLKYRFEPINKNIQLEANLSVLEKTRQKINKSLAKMKQKVQEDTGISEQICGLCCDQFKHPFKLQGCGHTFCFDCLQSSIKFLIQDITLYPIKCPQCMQKIWMSDLRCILQQKQWTQILKISINHFIYTHPGEFMFCMTAGCTFICNIKYKSSYSCPECKKGYCLGCRNLMHIGMTCHEARYGSDRLFGEYMLNVGGRVCANKVCKAPIQRISGCFKVQCSRCKKCMCFKCPPQSMIPYETPEETYNHMNRAHGGCF